MLERMLAPLVRPKKAPERDRRRPSGRSARNRRHRDRNTDRASAPRRYRRTFSPLTLRILAVNVLALAILVGGLLYLGRYQDRLIESELEALGTEARIFAGAIGEAAVTRDGDETNDLSPDLARQMVRRLVETTDTRTRLFDAFGRLMADSRVLIGPGGVVQIEELPPPIQGGWLTRLAIDLYDEIVNALPSREKFPVFREGPVQVANHYEDVVKALNGELSASVWTTPDHGMILTVAVPVQRYKQVLGAVMLSRGGAQIDAAIRSVRLDILKVFAVALAVTGAAVVLSGRHHSAADPQAGGGGGPCPARPWPAPRDPRLQPARRRDWRPFRRIARHDGGVVAADGRDRELRRRCRPRDQEPADEPPQRRGNRGAGARPRPAAPPDVDHRGRYPADGPA